MLHILYIIRWGILLLFSGCLVYNSFFFKEIPENNRFVIGVTSTPLVISLFDYGLGLIWPGAPVVLFRYLFPIIALLYILYRGNYHIIVDFFTSVIKYAHNRISVLGQPQALLFAFIGFIVSCGSGFYLIRYLTKGEAAFFPVYLRLVWLLTFIILLFILFFYVVTRKWSGLHIIILSSTCVLLTMSVLFTAYSGIQTTMPEWDECHYNMQARFFAEDRNSWEIDNYSGEKEGAILADDHGPLWEVIIADADFFSYDQLNSGMVRLCHAIIGILFFLAVFNYGSILAGVKCGILSVSLVLFYKRTMINTLTGPREAFRFIALYLFVLFMFNYIYSIFSRRESLLISKSQNTLIFNRIQWFVGVLMISYVAINGHGSNIVIMFSIFLVYSFIALWKKISFEEYCLTGVATLLGVLLCLGKMIRRYVETGRFISSTTWAFRDTATIDALAAASTGQISRTDAWATYSLEEILLVGFGVTSLIFVVFICWRRAGNNKSNSQLYIYSALNVAISFGMILPLSGIYDALGYKFSVYMIAQDRYRMYFLIVFAILGANMISILWNENKVLRIISYCLSVIVCIISVIISVSNTIVPTSDVDTSATDYHIATSNEILSEYHTFGNIFVSDQILGYFFREPTKLGFTEYNRPLLLAKSIDEIEQAIDDLDMELFVFSYQGEYYHYEVLPFYDYLQNSEKINRITYYDSNNDREIDVYIVDSEIWD